MSFKVSNVSLINGPVVFRHTGLFSRLISRIIGLVEDSHFHPVSRLSGRSFQQSLYVLTPSHSETSRFNSTNLINL